MGEVSIIGLDLAKNVFQAHGAAADGSVVFRRKLSRAQLLKFMAAQRPCVVAMEACASSHHWGRAIGNLGHDYDKGRKVGFRRRLRSSLIAEMQLRPACRQFLNQFAHLIGPVWHRSQVADFTAPLALRNRHRNRRLADIQPDERAILHVVSPPFLRLGARQPGATLERRMPRERPLTQSAHNAIMGSKLMLGCNILAPSPPPCRL